MSESTPPRDDRNGVNDMNEAFARVEDTGSKLALAVLSVVFALYVFGVLAPIVPLQDFPSLIGGGAGAFTRDNGVPTGWGFLTQLDKSDMLSLAAMMLMVGVVFVAYIMLIPGLLRRKDYLYLIMVVLQLGVFVLAGGGWLGGGH